MNKDGDYGKLMRKRIGNMGEQIACQFLQNKGFKIEARNYRRPWGEIDVIVSKNRVVRFVEVKTVSVADFSREIDHNPEDMVDVRKLRKVARTAMLYMEKTKDKREFQIDVVGILLNEAERKARCRLYEQVLGDSL